MHPAQRITNTHIQNAIGEITSAEDFSAESLTGFLEAMSYGIAFMLGIAQQISDGQITDQHTHAVIDSLAEQMKKAAKHASTFKPPMPN